MNRLLWLVILALIVLAVESWMLLVSPRKITPVTMRLSQIRWRDEDLDHVLDNKVIAIGYVYRASESTELYEIKSPFLSWVRNRSSGLTEVISGALMRAKGTYDLQLTPWIGWIETDTANIDKITSALKKAKREASPGTGCAVDGRYLYIVCADGTGTRISYRFNELSLFTDRTCIGQGWVSKDLARVLPFRAYWYTPEAWAKLEASASTRAREKKR